MKKSELFEANARDCKKILCQLLRYKRRDRWSRDELKKIQDFLWKNVDRYHVIDRSGQDYFLRPCFSV